MQQMGLALKNKISQDVGGREQEQEKQNWFNKLFGKKRDNSKDQIKKEKKAKTGKVE